MELMVSEQVMMLQLQLQIEQEKTKQIEQQEKTKQMELQEKTKQIEQQEKTKQLQYNYQNKVSPSKSYKDFYNRIKGTIKIVSEPNWIPTSYERECTVPLVDFSTESAVQDGLMKVLDSFSTSLKAIDTRNHTVLDSKKPDVTLIPRQFEIDNIFNICMNDGLVHISQGFIDVKKGDVQTPDIAQIFSYLYKTHEKVKH